MQNTMNGLYQLASQAKNAHWNVSGPSFYGYHKLLDEVDEEARDLGDRLAERMRFKEDRPEIKPFSGFPAVSMNSDAEGMVTTVIRALEMVYDFADTDRKDGDRCEAAMFDDVQEFCGKYIYLLRSFED